MTGWTSRAGAALVASVMAGLALCGCSGVPDDGPVTRAGQGEVSRDVAPFDFHPPGPRSGASPDQVVAGFLTALQATPASTEVATQFLATRAVDRWHPARGTLVYRTERVRTGSSPPGGGRPVAFHEPVRAALDRTQDEGRPDAAVEVVFSGVAELDARGRFRGDAGSVGGGRRSIAFHLVLERAEWRLTDPPDAVVIPQTHFSSRYREYALYFFDPSGTVLVPEPVYLPWGVQTSTLLVDGLLAGPPAYARRAERTFLPRGTELGVSVPVTGGLAEVPLSGEFADLDDQQLELALAQLAWTLRQVEEVRRMQVTVDGAALELPDGDQATSVGAYSTYSTTVWAASTDVFGVRDGDVRELLEDKEITAAPLLALGSTFDRPRSLGVSMSGQMFALASEDGSQVALLSREHPFHVRDLPVTDALKPMWDAWDRLWVVDRTSSGARVTVRRHDQLVPVRAPGLDGADLVATALSRDGSRLAALRRTGPSSGTGVEVTVSRVVRGPTGRPRALAAARTVSRGVSSLGTARSLGWRDPTTLAVLTRPTTETSQVVLVRSDGSTALPDLGHVIDLFFGDARAVLASPGGPQALLLAGPGGRLHELDPQGGWLTDIVPPGIRRPTFVG